MIRIPFLERRKARREEARREARNKALAEFRQRYRSFKGLLESNSELLGIISDMEHKLDGETAFGMAQVRSIATRLAFHTSRMVESLNHMSGRGYPQLDGRLTAIGAAIRSELESRAVSSVRDIVLPYTAIDRGMVDAVGGKNAHLGEMKSRVGVPVPPGFAITTRAYELFLDQGDLREEIRRCLLEADAADPESLVRASSAIEEIFSGTRVPGEVADAISAAFEALCAETGRRPLVALRSSAVGEDGELSFAGQYLSVLGVSEAEVLPAYTRILASLFSPRAIAYRLHKGVSFEDSAMSVACLELVPSLASGVVYSRHPGKTGRDAVLVNAVWGLGPYAVDGVVTPDAWTFSREHPPALLSLRVSDKDKRLAADAAGRLVDEPVSEELRRAPCLSDEQAMSLASFALALEEHFGCPQDIEWALSPSGMLYILQSRPLAVQGEAGHTPEPPTPGHDVLLEAGDTVHAGVGAGPVHHVDDPDELLAFPQGGVLVARHSSPNFVMAMGRAAAIVCDTGSVTGHMAALAREFRVPTLLNLKGASALLVQGQTVTVDARAGRIYAGEVPELLAAAPPREPFMKGTPVYETLRRVADLAVPLHLTDPKSKDFRPENCRSIHDIMRFAHERSYTEMFRLSDAVSDAASIAARLTASIPLDLYVIDLGGGLASTQATACVEDVTSTPLAAVLRGMLVEELSTHRPKPVDLGGFLSVMSRQMIQPPNLGTERFGERSYAIASDKYLNFSSRVGYHYSILDSYCGQTVNKNYITFEFKGGAADDVRRNRRARAIARILRELGFSVEAVGDRVTARLMKYEREVIAERLDQIGRLLLFTRQMDMLMQSEDSVERMAACFLAGDYACELTLAVAKD